MHIPVVLDKLRKQKFNIPQKIIAIGTMDTNWGWLSTYFLNRTVAWALSLDPYTHPGKAKPFHPKYKSPIDDVKELLDDPNLLMMVVNQHHNVSIGCGDGLYDDISIEIKIICSEI